MRILITGGACAGKTTCIDYLKKHLEDKNIKVAVFDEVPTKMIQGGETPESMGNIEFLNEVIKRQLEDLSISTQCEDVVCIFDGSPIDGMKFVFKDELDEIFKNYNTSYDEILNFYDYIIHLESVAVKMPELYSNEGNLARTLDVEKSAERDELIKKAYERFEKRFVVPVYEKFEDKWGRFVEIIDKIL